MVKTQRESATHRLTRRRFMGLTGAGIIGGALIAACGDDDDSGQPAAPQARADTQASGNGQTQGATEGTVVVGDVLDHGLSSDEWTGDFGFVTFRLHTGSVSGS